MYWLIAVVIALIILAPVLGKYLRRVRKQYHPRV